MSRARCYGPAGDMSLTSGGYVLRTEGGTWVRSTVVIEPRDWQALQEQRDAEAEAENRAREPDLSQAPSPEVPLPRAAGDGGRGRHGGGGAGILGGVTAFVPGHPA